MPEGLPNLRLFPVQELSEAARKVLDEFGPSALQYSITEGHLPLREYVSRRYAKRGVKVSPEEILITNGSQQGAWTWPERFFLIKATRSW